jgi:helix-turn-helix protein
MEDVRKMITEASAFKKVLKEEYQGWSNYATWGVALIIDNDQGLHEETLELAREHADAGTLSEAIKEWVDVMVSEVENSSEMIQQIFQAGYSDVNWYELAEHFKQTQTEIDSE